MKRSTTGLSIRPRRHPGHPDEAGRADARRAARRLAVKVTSGVFLVGLSAVEADMQRNLQLLKERAWFDIPIVYNNGRRAILALEKGNPGERALEETFKAWEQTSAKP